jgi:hypothetical protein
MKGWGMKDWDDGVGAPRDRDGRDVAAEGWVGDLLRAEAARHQPDRDRILAAIVARKRADRAGPGTVSSLDGRRRLQASQRIHDLGDARDLGDLGDARDLGDDRGVRGRAHLAWPVVAASVAVLTMATVAGARALAPDTPVTVSPVAPVLPGNSTLGPAITIEGSPTSDGSGTRTGPARPSSGTALADDSPTSTTTTTTKQESSLSRAVAVRISPAGDGTRLSLPRNGDRDWIVVGGQQDGRLTRAKRPDRALGTVSASGAGPSATPGPYDISWLDGVPVQNATVSTWRSITADGRMRITVPLRGDRLTVDLFAGTVKATGLVTVSLAGSSGAVTTTVPPCSVATCADVISVTLDSSRLSGGGASGELIIDLGPARPGNGGGMGLAAVVLH